MWLACEDSYCSVDSYSQQICWVSLLLCVWRSYLWTFTLWNVNCVGCLTSTGVFRHDLSSIVMLCDNYVYTLYHVIQLGCKSLIHSFLMLHILRQQETWTCILKSHMYFILEGKLSIKSNHVKECMESFVVAMVP